MRLRAPKCGLHHILWRVQEGRVCEKWKSLGPDPETLIKGVWAGPWNLHLTGSPLVAMHSHLRSSGPGDLARAGQVDQMASPGPHLTPLH